ncbi:YqgE/AlgH family protein [Oxalobacteraceae bacterium OM1]|nr:YqgE/AlgH family protein [Oxalobacteraceae bacterium OM1]
MVKPSKTRLTPSRPDPSQDTPDFSASGNDAGTGLNLANHFLIAMPSMLDPMFGGTVIYMCQHNDEGALGVIINKPTDMNLDVLLERVDLEIQVSRTGLDQTPVLFGGPVQVERGFVLHTPTGAYSSSMRVTDEIALTTSKDVLEAVAMGAGPSRMLMMLGCAGWSPGQLEEELGNNGWLTVPAEPHIIFDVPIEQRFSAAMKLLGIDPLMLAGDAGHA